MLPIPRAPGDTPGPPEPASAGVGAAVDGVAGPAEAPDLGLDGVAGPRADGVGVAGSPESDRGELPDATVAAVVDDELAGLLGAAAGYVAAAKAANTRTAYASDWARFAGWCADRELAAMPAAPATLGAYLTAAATDPAPAPGYTPATLARWTAAVNFAHRRAGHPAPGAHPHVGELLAGIRREHGRPPARRDALVTADLRAILAALPAGWPAVVAARRDAAILVVGFAGAFRRGELAALDVADVRAHRTDGLHVTVRAAKNDPGREGQVKAVPYGSDPATCGPCAWARWRAVVRLAAAGGRVAVMRAVLADDPAAHVCRSPAAAEADGDGAEPAFRALDKGGRVLPGRLSGPAVTKLVKRRAAAAGYDPARLGGHSLRAGFVTAAVLAGADAHAIMRQTGHRTPAMIEVYTRHHAPLEANAVTRLGL